MNVFRKFAIAIGASLAMAAAACSAAPETDGPAETVGSKQEALACGFWQYQAWYTIDGDPPVKLQPISTHLCWLTRVGGRFSGSKQHAGIDVEAHGFDDFWYLETHGQNEWGEAHCIPRNCFSGGAQQVSSALNFSALAEATPQGSCETWDSVTWTGDAVTFLQGYPSLGGWAGDCATTSTYGSIIQSTSTTAKSKVRARDCTFEGSIGKAIHTSATSFRVGAPGGALARLSQTFWTEGNGTRNLIRPDQGICYLTHIGGKFRDSDDYVSVWIDGGADTWKLTTHHGSDGFVHADARCFFFQQNP